MSLGNVTSSTAGASSVGNSIDISGGDITTGNLTGLALTLSGHDLSLGSVATTGRGEAIHLMFTSHV
ncbi:MAG: hypothetical protein IPJ48_21870 [Propionivibrio sp.]|uniref:Uncharacterized protein n=1 Tax=Candidatus Propionivibrio dominans TaxID=2954373 RepID=A0A9D7FH59_9RHOO|nr:hypothetical protein [Candidatus Propionivibrio dominans]